ncbi:MAG: hypothetical protein CMA72_09335 [Euryarchaeota archaeon]|nr:hypothetical protein [Euryarchaeota archaeon]
MPKVVITNSKGLVQETGTGFEPNTSGLARVFWTATTTLNAVGANDVEMTLTQPANTVITDMGWVFDTNQIAGTSGNSKIKFGTADDGAELVALTDIMSSATATAAGSGISLSGLRSEGDAALVVVNSAPMYTATARTVFIRIENSAAVTAGEGRAFIVCENLG